MTILGRMKYLKQLAAIHHLREASEASASTLLRLLEDARITRDPYIFLLENGNYRALWDDAAGRQIGLQCLPDGKIRYVMIANDLDLDQPRTYVYGEDVIAKVWDVIESMQLDDLLLKVVKYAPLYAAKGV